jgi:hypothetical protein
MLVPKAMQPVCGCTSRGQALRQPELIGRGRTPDLFHLPRSFVTSAIVGALK